MQRLGNFGCKSTAGLQADLAGDPFPVHRVSLEGKTGYGILGFTWLEAPPPHDNFNGTVLITSREPGAVTAELAARILGTVRAERCAVVRQMLIPRFNRKLHLPVFVGGDPLGKTRPDDESPEYKPPGSPLLMWSEAQVAFLLPLNEELSACVAPLVRADAISSPILHMQVLSPTGTHKELLAGYVAQCQE